MGLLSDPEYGSVKWVRVLKRIHGPLCCLCYLGALVWFVMLGNQEFNNETYFSENALLPGLVTNEFNGEQAGNQYYKEFLQELEDKYEDTGEMPVPWLVAKMSQLNLEVYTHNFTLDYPLGQGQIFKGTNVYGILRAPRTSSLEAIVVSAPYRPLTSYQKQTAAGIALMLAFAKFAAPQKYWAKDIIFLVTEHEQLGMQAWLEAYHGLQSDAETFRMSLGSFWKPSTPRLDLSQFLPGFNWFGVHQKCLKPGKLKGRSGSIQAAINLEFDSPKIKYVEVKIEGLNGQLPNLDLVNLVHKLCIKSGIHHSYRNSYSWIRNRNKMDEWMNGFWTMFNMVAAQIDGVPDGNHGLFHRFGIEAVTLEGRDANDPAGSPPRVHSLHGTSFYRLGIALESTLRSLNNLLERFHQSYFFYLLAATNRFISIGQYMITLCLLCLAILIRALSQWVSLQQDEEDDNQKKENEKKKKPKDSNSEVLGDKKTEAVGTQKGGDRNKKTEKAKDFDSEVLGDEKTEAVGSQKGGNRNKKTEKAKDSDSEVPGDEKTEAVGSQKGGNRNKKTEKAKDSDSEVPGDEKTEAVGSQKGGNHNKKTEKAKHSDSQVLGDKKSKKAAKKKYRMEDSSMSVVNIGANYLLVHLIGYAVMNSPILFSKIGSVYDYPPEVAIYYGLIATSLVLTIITPFLPRLVRQGRITFEELSLVNILLLVELATVCMSVGMHNFPLGLVVAVVYTPIALMTGIVTKGRSKKGSVYLLFRRVLCLLVHPLAAVSMGMIAYSRVLFKEEGLWDTMLRGKDAAMQATMFSIADSMIYGNWLFNLTTAVILPIWMIFWQILCIEVEAPV